MLFWKKKSYKEKTFGGLSPDEVFLDSANIHGFSRERFEGVLERPIEKGVFFSFGVLLVFVGLVFVGRVTWLDIVRGQELRLRSEGNYIETTLVEPPRGIIFDRSGIPLVSNEASTTPDGKVVYMRVARHPFAFSHILGFVGEAGPDDNPKAGLKDTGKSGIERFYNNLLEGTPGKRDEEIDAQGNVISRGPLKAPRKGNDIALTIDAGLQEKLWETMDQVKNERGFLGGAGVMYSLTDGAVRALVSIPSFDINKIAGKLSHDEAAEIFQNTEAPLFNRTLSGKFAPGSIVKPFYSIAALEEGIITPDKQLFSSGSISIPDPYHPGQVSTFMDNKAHGFVDMRRAIAVSSNVYFYTIGGGFGDQKGLGIERLKRWLSRFRLDQKTGIDLAGEESGFLPDPEWKKNAHPQNPIWRIGDTYHASIGQGDVLFNPLGVAEALSLLATDGEMVRLHLLKGEKKPREKVLDIDPAYFSIVRDGMKRVVGPEGSGNALSWFPEKIAAKTGTAEVGGKKDRINSWFMGYLPADNPKFAIVIMMEAGPRTNTIGSVFVVSQTLQWMLDHGGVDAFTD